MLAGISHDLRSPIVRLRHNIELGKPGLTCAAADSMVRDIKASCVVLGMPKEAIRFGAAERVLPLEELPRAILRA
jgi:hypothetical protein